MDTNPTSTSAFVPLATAAHRLGVPTARLRREAEACRIPHIRTGSRVMVSVTELEAVLLDRARRATSEEVKRES